MDELLDFILMLHVTLDSNGRPSMFYLYSVYWYKINLTKLSDSADLLGDFPHIALSLDQPGLKQLHNMH